MGARPTDESQPDIFLTVRQAAWYLLHTISNSISTTPTTPEATRVMTGSPTADKTFGEWLRHRRLAQGISPFVMADALGYKRVSAIYNFEYGVAPLPLSKWPTMAQLVGLSVDEFVTVMDRFSPHKAAEFRLIQQSVTVDSGAAYEPIPTIVGRTMTALLSLEEAVHRYRLADAETALVAETLTTETLIEVTDWLRHEKQWKVGFLQPLTRDPFPATGVVESLKSLRFVVVLDPTVGPAGLAALVKAAFIDALTEAGGYPRIHYVPPIFDVRLAHGSRSLTGPEGYQLLRNIQQHRERRYLDLIPSPAAKSR